MKDATLDFLLTFLTFWELLYRPLGVITKKENYSRLQIGWNRILRLFLKTFNLVPRVPGFSWDLSLLPTILLRSTNHKSRGQNSGTFIFFGNNIWSWEFKIQGSLSAYNVKIRCHPLKQCRDSVPHIETTSRFGATLCNNVVGDP